MWIQVTTVGDLLDRRAELSDREALVMPGVRLTYPQLSNQTDEFAACLIGLGVGPGDKVGILMPNGLDFVLALIATTKIGAIAVPINGRFKVHECSHVISHSDVTVLLTSADPHGTDYPALITEVFPAITNSDPHQDLQLPDAPLLRRVVDLVGSAPGFLTRADFQAHGVDVRVEQVKTLQSRVRVRDVALLMYTSGTTARPKGCLLTHEAITRLGEAVARTRFFMTETDSFWDPLPFFHCGGFIPMLGCFSVGAKYCHPVHFDAAEALRMLAAGKCTVVYSTFETIWTPVVNHPDFEATDLSSVRILHNVVTPERIAQYEARMPWARQVSAYGSTEAATNLTLPMPDDPYEIRMTTNGLPLEGMQIRIVDPETNVELEPGSMGEICFRGYAMFEGYYKDAEATAKAVDEHGWFHSGDRGKLDAAGYLTFGGRLKDMLKVGGENVAAIELEDFLARNSAVAIAQVVGVPDARYGEVPAAYVQLLDGSTLTEDEVVDFCIGSIATYKVPRYVRFVTEWPMSGTKIQKFALRDRLVAELDAAGITEAPKPRERALS